MSYLATTIEVSKEMRNEMLNQLQKDYDAMVAIAELCDYDLTPKFEAELTRLMEVVKSLGGRV